METKYQENVREGSYVRGMYRKGVLALTLGLAGLVALVSGGCVSGLPDDKTFDKYFERFGEDMQRVEWTSRGLDKEMGERFKDDGRLGDSLFRFFAR